MLQKGEMKHKKPCCPLPYCKVSCLEIVLGCVFQVFCLLDLSLCLKNVLYVLIHRKECLYHFASINQTLLSNVLLLF